MPNITGILNGAAGTAQGKVGTTIQTLAISLASGFVLFGVQFGAFLLFRNYLWSKRIYQPRAFLVPLKNRVNPPPNNPFRWICTVFKIPEDTEVLQKAGMDAYFFLRYLRMCLKIFFPMALLILPILIPLNVASGKSTHTIARVHYNVTGLDTLAWSNVSPEHTNRYWAHLILGVGVVAWVCFIFYTELMHYIAKRQEFLSSPGHRLKASSTTVLITDIPHELCNLDALTALYDDFPGGVRRIWINRDFTALVDKAQTRTRFENLLEDAETDLIRKALKKHRQQQKRETKSAASDSTAAQPVVNKDRTDDEPASLPADTASEHDISASQEEVQGPATPSACASDLQYDLETKAAWTRYLKPKQRPTMRIAKGNHTTAFKFPIVGRLFSTKVDTIYYCRRELARLNQEVEVEIEKSETYPQNYSAFIQFNSQKGAHLACQALADTKPRRMTQRKVEISPADVNWANLGLSWKARYVRFVGFLLLLLLLGFLFGVISFFTGILSRVSTLAGSTSWLHWVGTLPKWLLSFVQGTLPPVIQVILLSGPLPIILRALTNHTKGATTGSQGERSLQLWYFIFLLVELFIIPTISSGLTSVVQEILHNPFGTSIPSILATNLPTASNYYFSFLVVQALSISASSILQTIRLFNYYVLGGANTPDRVFDKLSWTNRTRIGSNIPWYTTFAVVGLVYCVIAPLMLIFMIITFSLFWIVIKNNLLYVVRTGNVDGGGLFLPSAINQTFTGLYFMEICLIGLFFLVRDVQDRVACQAQGIIMAVVFVLTILYQIWLATNIQSLYKYAPIRMEGDAARRDKEYELERLAVPVQHSELDSEKTVDDHEQLVDPLSHDDAVPATPDTHQKAELVDEKSRSSGHSRTSTAVLPASRDIQAEKRRDGESAKRILARINRPLNPERLADLENHLAQVEARVGNVLVPRQKDIEQQMMNDPISQIIMQHNDELEDLDAEERDMLISVAFTHPVLRGGRPSVWIPQDDLGISDDEIQRTVHLSEHVAIDNRGAFFDRRLKVEVNKPPPDMSEFALVMAEL